MTLPLATEELTPEAGQPAEITPQDMMDLRNQSVSVANLAGVTEIVGWRSSSDNDGTAHFRQESAHPGFSPEELTISPHSAARLTIIHTKHEMAGDTDRSVAVTYDLGATAEDSRVVSQETRSSFGTTFHPATGRPAFTNNRDELPAQTRALVREDYDQLLTQISTLASGQRTRAEGPPPKSRAQRVSDRIGRLLTGQ